MKQTFTDKVVVVTGGTSGIGKEIARQLALKGAHAVIVGRSKKTGKQAVKELKDDGLAVAYEQFDMAKAKDAAAVVKRVAKNYGRIDYFFNNAGSFLGGELRDTPLEDWHAVTESNWSTVMNGTHYAYEQMLAQGHGHIVNTASSAGLFPVPAMAIYGATKYAVVGLTHELRNEAKALGIKASAVCPTVIDTPLWDSAMYHGIDVAKAMKSRNKIQTPETAAKRIIKGVAKNKATIHTSAATQFGWLSYRFLPGAYNIVARRLMKLYRAKLRSDS